MVGTGLRITVPKDELVAGARRGRRVPSRRARRCQILSRDPARAAGGRAAARSDRHGALAAQRARLRRSTATARRRPGKTLARHRAARCPATRSRSSTSRTRRLSYVTAGTRELQAAHVQQPRTSRACRMSSARRCTRSTARRCSRRSHASARSASRDESAPGAHGDPRAVRAGQARHGGDRLVPARREGDPVEGTLPELEAIIPAARSRSSPASRPAPTICSSACRRTTWSSAPTERG